MCDVECRMRMVWYVRLLIVLMTCVYVQIVMLIECQRDLIGRQQHGERDLDRVRASAHLVRHCPDRRHRPRHIYIKHNTTTAI